MRPIAFAAPVAALAAGLALAGPSQAQDSARYRLEPSGEGYVRMDTRTGEMSVCRMRGEQLVCTLAADERRAYDAEIDALHGRLDALEQRLAALEQGAPADGGEALPSEEEFEQTLGLMERFMRRFMGVMRDLERDFGAPPAEGGAPGEGLEKT